MLRYDYLWATEEEIEEHFRKTTRPVVRCEGIEKDRRKLGQLRKLANRLENIALDKKGNCW